MINASVNIGLHVVYRRILGNRLLYIYSTPSADYDAFKAVPIAFGPSISYQAF